MDAKVRSIVAQINEGLAEPLPLQYSVRMAETIITLADKAYPPEYRGAVRVVLAPVINSPSYASIN